MWETVRLGDVANLYQPKTITKKEMTDDGEYPVYGANGVIGNFHSYNHEEPQLVIGCRGSCGEVNVTHGKCWITGNAMVIQPNEAVLKEYLRYFLLQRHITSAVISGTAQPQITRKSLAPIELPLPPLAEQQRIVAKLDAAFAEIDRAIGSAEATRTQVQSLELGAVKATFDKFSEHLEYVQLDTLCTKITDGVHKKPVYQKSGIPFLKINNLTEGNGISFEKTSFISEIDHQEFIKRTHPEKGDILITKDGTIGIVRQIETDREFSIFVSLALVKPTDKKNSNYLTHVLRSAYCQNQLSPSGAALKHIYLKDLRRLIIPISTDAINAEIVGELNEVEEQIRRIKESLNSKTQQLTAVKSAILAQELQPPESEAA